jgi:hypothetical protein
MEITNEVLQLDTWYFVLCAIINRCLILYESCLNKTCSIYVCVLGDSRLVGLSPDLIPEAVCSCECHYELRPDCHRVSVKCNAVSTCSVCTHRYELRCDCKSLGERAVLLFAVVLNETTVHAGMFWGIKAADLLFISSCRSLRSIGPPFRGFLVWRCAFCSEWPVHWLHKFYSSWYDRQSHLASNQETWVRNDRWILLTKHLYSCPKVLLHAVNLRHGTDGFTSPPKEVVLRICITLKNPSTSAGIEPANKAADGCY